MKYSLLQVKPERMHAVPGQYEFHGSVHNPVLIERDYRVTWADIVLNNPDHAALDWLARFFSRKTTLIDIFFSGHTLTPGNIIVLEGGTCVDRDIKRYWYYQSAGWHRLTENEIVLPAEDSIWYRLNQWPAS